MVRLESSLMITNDNSVDRVFYYLWAAAMRTWGGSKKYCPRTAVREIQTPIRGQYLLCSSRPLGRDEQSEAQIEGFSPRSVRLGSPPNVRIAAAHKLYISQAGSGVQNDLICYSCWMKSIKCCLCQSHGGSRGWPTPYSIA